MAILDEPVGVAWRAKRHIDETGHVVVSTLYTQDSRRIDLIQCQGCDFKDWRVEFY